MPHYQASSIWGNSHITALIFFFYQFFFLILDLITIFLDKKNIFFNAFFNNGSIYKTILCNIFSIYVVKDLPN